MYRFHILAIIFTLVMTTAFGQDDQYKVAALGFYNLENLFDYEDDPTINDEEFLPSGTKAWTKEKYEEKLANMAYVISQIGTDLTPAGLSVLGVSEIENRRVLEDLVAQQSIAERNYQIVHVDSKDRRGVDVGLLYNPAHFEVMDYKVYPVNYIEAEDDTLRTRDILRVTGKLDGEKIDVFVNHWPSRYGGEKRSAPKRNRAAMVARSVMDSILQEDPSAKFVLMGDLNDDPTSESLVEHLRSKGKISDVTDQCVFNPMYDYYRRGIGSNAYRDGWSLFDQIVLSPSLLGEDQDGYRYYKATIFNKKYLVQRSGQYRGYPFRTFSFDKYQGGYSDHFPVLVYLVKKI